MEIEKRKFSFWAVQKIGRTIDVQASDLASAKKIALELISEEGFDWECSNDLQFLIEETL